MASWNNHGTNQCTFLHSGGITWTSYQLTKGTEDSYCGKHAKSGACLTCPISLHDLLNQVLISYLLICHWNSLTSPMEFIQSLPSTSDQCHPTLMERHYPTRQMHPPDCLDLWSTVLFLNIFVNVKYYFNKFSCLWFQRWTFNVERRSTVFWISYVSDNIMHIVYWHCKH